MIIVSNELVRDGEGCVSRRRCCGCGSRVPASVGYVAKFAGIFVAPYVELDF